jgi:hypothetical protein
MAQPLAKQLFGAATGASKQRATAYGSYAKGCAAGSEQLPETGPTWQAMRLSRNRNWGHPETIDFIKKLSAFAAKQPGWKGLYIGDISQPRGGPMLSGHRSHQIGLDVDIWMLPASRVNLSRQKRENISSISLRRSNGAFVNDNWSRTHHRIIKQAATDALRGYLCFRVPRCRCARMKRATANTCARSGRGMGIITISMSGWLAPKAARAVSIRTHLPGEMAVRRRKNGSTTS